MAGWQHLTASCQHECPNYTNPAPSPIIWKRSLGQHARKRSYPSPEALPSSAWKIVLSLYCNLYSAKFPLKSAIYGFQHARNCNNVDDHFPTNRVAPTVSKIPHSTQKSGLSLVKWGCFVLKGLAVRGRSHRAKNAALFFPAGQTLVRLAANPDLIAALGTALANHATG